MNSSDKQEKLLTPIADVPAHLGLSQTTVYKLVVERQFPVVRRGRGMLVAEEDVQKLVIPRTAKISKIYINEFKYQSSNTIFHLKMNSQIRILEISCEVTQPQFSCFLRIDLNLLSKVLWLGLAMLISI